MGHKLSERIREVFDELAVYGQCVDILVAEVEELERQALPKGWEPLDLINREKKLLVMGARHDWSRPIYCVSMGSHGIPVPMRGKAAGEPNEDWRKVIADAEAAAAKEPTE